MEVSYKTIGQNIRRARLKIGLTQEKASQQLGVSTMHWDGLNVENAQSSWIGFAQ